MAPDYRGLGFDPAPGSRDAVASSGARLSELAERAGTAEADLRRVTGLPAGWAGEASDAFVAGLSALARSLATVRAEFVAAARVLDDWLDKLAPNQRAAEELDRQAVALRSRLTEAEDILQRLTTEADFLNGPARETVDQEITEMRRRHQRYRTDLDRILDRARDLRHDHLAEAARVAERLRAVPADGPPEASPFAADPFRPATTSLDRWSSLSRQVTSVLSPLGSTDSESAPPPPGAADAFAAAVAGPPADPWSSNPFESGR
ncbi:hypothetical protein [Amycolatopsis anabasis]|uniref:hypothetical protein n=1 Tax=Amycolatopsis anabasis TaxID=1840409 RepID=UPI00131C54F4|nr:hypothetical protein [Amycolatopsis anabasis]